jgi:RNase P/RNase MRP subunit p29
MSNSVLNQSWIGRYATIVSSTDPNHVGRTGMVADETRETITLLENNKAVVFGKSSIDFKLGDSDVTIVGSLMRQRAEDRIYRNHRSE